MRILNLETWTWSTAHAVPARYNHSACLIGTKLWVYAGKDEAGQTVSDLHSIDLVTLRVLPHTGITGQVVLLKSQHFSEAIGNQLVVFGKYPNEVTAQSLYGLWILDLEQLEWRKLDIDQCLGEGMVWNYFTIVTKKPQLQANHRRQLSSSHAHDAMVVDPTRRRLRSSSSLSQTSGHSGGGNGSHTGGGGGDDYSVAESEIMDLEDSGSAPCLIFLGNTEKERPQPYDHFRDVLSINVEYLGVFHVHRMVLSSRWPHFRNMHASGMIESTRASMVLPEPYAVVYAFLSFLYTDTVDVDLDYTVVCDVLIMANMYLLERLKKLCTFILHRHHLHVDSCVRIFQAAHVSQEYGLKKLSQEFIFQNCGAVMKTEDWMLMWTLGGSEGATGEQRAALDEFIDGIPGEASLGTHALTRRSMDGYGPGNDSLGPFEPSLKDL
jgi:hypothetical protein